MVTAHFELTWDIRRQAFFIAQEFRYDPIVIHEQLKGACQFPAGEFEAMQEFIYGSELKHLDD